MNQELKQAPEWAIWMLIFLVLAVIYGLLSLTGPEPEITAADYQRMLCESSPGEPVCRADKMMIAGAR